MVLKMPEASPEDIWVYIYEKGEVRSRDLEKKFIDTGLLSRGTMYKYRRILEAEGKINPRPVPNARPTYNLYYVPEKFHPQLEAVKYRQKIKSVLDNLPPTKQIVTINLWLEIEMVVREMLKMGYSPEEIRSMVEASLEALHSRLVDRIVEDEEK